MTPDEMFQFEVAAAGWKDRTASIYTRLIVLDGKAQDSGLTDEEEEERDWLTMWAGQELSKFLHEIKLRGES